MTNEELLEKIGNLIKAETEPIKAEIQVINQAIIRIEQKLNREVTDLAEHIGEIMTKLDMLDDHERL